MSNEGCARNKENMDKIFPSHYSLYRTKYLNKIILFGEINVQFNWVNRYQITKLSNADEHEMLAMITIDVNV